MEAADSEGKPQFWLAAFCTAVAAPADPECGRPDPRFGPGGEIFLPRFRVHLRCFAPTARACGRRSTENAFCSVFLQTALDHGMVS